MSKIHLGAPRLHVLKLSYEQIYLNLNSPRVMADLYHNLLSTPWVMANLNYKLLSAPGVLAGCDQGLLLHQLLWQTFFSVLLTEKFA